MNRNTGKITEILKQIRLLKNKHDELVAATGENFNVFSILRIRHEEVKTHTPILAELLNPHGSHYQKADFLKLFLEKICVKSKEPAFAFDSNPESYRVRSEKRIDQTQFDIMLEKKDEARIVIENKILAGDQNNQLFRLYQGARKNFGGQVKLIYLTLDGSQPGEDSLKSPDQDDVSLNQDEFQCISYRDEIIPWLEECSKLQAVQRIAPIREILFQYRNLLKDLTGQPTNTNTAMKLSNLLTEDENYELIPQLEQALLESKVQSQIRFWEELAEKLAENIGDLHIKGIKYQRNCKSEDEQLEDCVDNYYRAAKKRSFFLYFKIRDWEQSEIALVIENDSYRIFYGFCLLGDGEWKNSDHKSYNSLQQKVSDKNYTLGERYIGWKYPIIDLRFPLQYPGSDEEFLFLLHKEKRREAVQKLAEEIAKEVEKFMNDLSKIAC